MGWISSINFKKSTSFQVFHNATIRPNYAIGGSLEVTAKGYEAKKIKEKIISEAIAAYEKNKSPKAPKFKAKNYEWSAICNIKETTTMQDLEKLAKHFENKYGFQCYQIAIHRDEGHINEQGEKVINHHAHLEFITLDKEKGKQVFKMRDFPPSKMREIQTEVAEILQMQRGQDKRISGAKRVEPRIYAKMKEEEKQAIKELKNKTNQLIDNEVQKNKELENNNQELQTKLNQETLTQKQIKEAFEKERQELIKSKNATQQDYKTLSEAKKKALEIGKSSGLTSENLVGMIQEALEKIKQLQIEKLAEKETNKIYKNQIDFLETDNSILNAEITTQKDKIDYLEAEVNVLNYETTTQNQTIQDLNQKIQELENKLKEQEKILKELLENLTPQELETYKQKLEHFKGDSSQEK